MLSMGLLLLNYIWNYEWKVLTSTTSAWLEIRRLMVWGWACYLLVTEAVHNTNFLQGDGEETFLFFDTLIPSSSVTDKQLEAPHHHPHIPNTRIKQLTR